MSRTFTVLGVALLLVGGAVTASATSRTAEAVFPHMLTATLANRQVQEPRDGLVIIGDRVPEPKTAESPSDAFPRWSDTMRREEMNGVRFVVPVQPYPHIVLAMAGLDISGRGFWLESGYYAPSLIPPSGPDDWNTLTIPEGYFVNQIPVEYRSRLLSAE